jgi:signal peptidase I
LKNLKSSLVNNLKALFWALLIAGVIRTFVIEPFKIPSGSMKPNLLVGDFLFVSKWNYGYSRYSFPFGLAPFSGKIFEKNPERGDIIVFKLPGQENINYVKRLLGLPGETIKVMDGEVFIKKNDSANFEKLNQVSDDFFFDDQYQEEIKQLIEDNYKILNITDNGPLDYTPEYEIPENKYFFMGDNRDNSSDSRVMSGVGFVPKENMIGKVWFIWLSIDTQFSLTKFWTLPLHIRYGRLFKSVK